VRLALPQAGLVRAPDEDLNPVFGRRAHCSANGKNIQFPHGFNKELFPNVIHRMAAYSDALVFTKIQVFHPQAGGTLRVHRT